MTTFCVCATPYVRATVTQIMATRLNAPAAFARRRNAICVRAIASLAPVGLTLKPMTMLAIAGMAKTSAIAMVRLR